jgi:hypothetical protein
MSHTVFNRVEFDNDNDSDSYSHSDYDSVRVYHCCSILKEYEEVINDSSLSFTSHEEAHNL